MGRLLGLRSRRDPPLRRRLAEQDMVAQVRLEGRDIGRRFVIEGGRVSSKAGVHSSPDMTLSFRSAHPRQPPPAPPARSAGVPERRADRTDEAAGRRRVRRALHGSARSALSPPPAAGRQMPGGVTRYTSNTNGGPVFVDVKDGRILRHHLRRWPIRLPKELGRGPRVVPLVRSTDRPKRHRRSSRPSPGATAAADPATRPRAARRRPGSGRLE